MTPRAAFGTRALCLTPVPRKMIERRSRHVDQSKLWIHDRTRSASSCVYWLPIAAALRLLARTDGGIGICCSPVEQRASQSVYMHIIGFHHTLQAVWIRARKHCPPFSSHHAKSHFIDYPSPAPRKWLMHLVYIITNVLFALQLNCDCYVQSMGKGHGIAPASALMEKSMRIHFNHCGCGRMSTTLRDCQWPGNYRCLYRFLLWQFRYPQISLSPPTPPSSSIRGGAASNEVLRGDAGRDCS